MSSITISFLERFIGPFLCCCFTFFYKLFKLFVNKRIDVKSSKILFVKFIEQGALVLHQNTFKESVLEYGVDNVYICTFSSNRDLMETIGVIPEKNRIFIDEHSFVSFTVDFFRAILKIRKQKIDTAIDLEFFSCATAIFCYLTGCVKRVGYHRYAGAQNYRGDLFTHRHNYSHYVHVAESSWYLLKSVEQPAASFPALNIDPVKNLVTDTSFESSADDLVNLNKVLGFDITLNKNIIVINPSLNDMLPLRRWPEEYYRKIIRRLIQQFPTEKIVLTGREDEYELTEHFISSIGSETPIYNLCGKTSFRDLLTLYSYAKLLLTSDSGPAHFASLTRVDILVLFGPETPDLYSPLSLKTKVFYKSLPCSPCYNVYNNRTSPCTNNICMQKISVDEVLNYINSLYHTKGVV